MAAHAHPSARRAGAEVRLEVADVFRRFGPAFLRDNVITPAQGKALRATMACRTAALGGHADVCANCGHTAIAYNSCRDRHCPTCQGSQAARWVAERVERLIDTHYFHVVFTLPAELRPIALANPAVVYDLLFAAATDTLLQLAADRWHAQPAITAVLHTWTRTMELHPHLHCVVSGGGLSTDGERWFACRPRYLFPVKVLSRLFRGKLLDGLARARRAGRLRFVGSSAELDDPTAWDALLAHLYRSAFVVYAKPPFGGPEQVLSYLGRYTHRVAIGSSRLVSIADDAVVFRTRGNRRCTLHPHEFVRRFLLHVLPHGYRKIRHFGLLAPANVPTRLVRAQALAAALLHPFAPSVTSTTRTCPEPQSGPPECPVCGGGLVRLLVERARPPPHPDDA